MTLIKKIGAIAFTIAVLYGALFVYKKRRMQNQRLLGYVEDYFTSMHPPHINTPEVYAWFSGLNYPIFNAVTHFYHTTNITDHVDTILKDAPHGKPVSFWINSLQDGCELINVLTQRGFKKIASFPLMAWPVTAIKKPVHTIKRVTPDTNATYHDIIAVVSEFNEELKKGHQKLLDNSSAQNYLLYSDGIPVAAGTLFVTGNVGAIFNINVLPAYQKKGYGTAISQFLMYKAHELCLQTVVLNSAPIARKMYEKLGFVKKFDVDIYARS